MRPNWFVGFPVDAEEWFARIGEAPPAVRQFHPEDLHLTLAFLGPVTPAQAAAGFEAARAIRLGPTAISLGRVVPMGNPRHFSALSARLHTGEQALAQAMTEVRDSVCDAAGARRESRPALPHLTVARPLRRATAEQRARALRWAEQLELGAPTLTITSVALYTWSRRDGERLFTTTERFLLLP